MAKKKTWLWVLVAVLAGIFLTPSILSLFVKDNDNVGDQNGGESYVLIEIYDANLEWQEKSMTIDLIKGSIKTNQQVDKIFVNVNGIGTQYLDFTPTLIRTDSSSYIAHAIPPTNDILMTAFASDTLITIDVYVEYAGRSYKVDTQKVQMISCWIGPY